MLTKPQFFYNHTTKQALGIQNPFYLKKAQQLEPKLYDGNVIKNTSAIVIPDSEETLMLAEESRSKMLLKQKDPMMLEKKVNTTPVDYANFVNSPEPTLSSRPTKVEVPKELSKVSMVNTSLKKLKYHLDGFDVVSVEISNLNASLVEKVLEITALKDDLRKLKGKALVDNAVTKHTIDPEMLKIDVEPITPKLLNKKTTHSTYIKHTLEEATVLRDLVEHVKSKYPLDHSLESAYRYAKLIQELLTYISKTCLSVNNTNGKLVAVTPKNKDKRVRFTKPVTSSGYTITKTASTSNLVSNKPMLSSIENSKLNANSELKCVKCKGKVLQIWIASGDLLVEPITIVRNACPLIRITTTTEVPLRKLTALENETPKPVEPRQSWGSIVSDVPSSSLDECRSSKLFSGTDKFRNDHVAKILGYGDYQIENVTISRVYYVEGLGHNLFSVGQFCDLNLEVAFVNTPTSFEI
ncbi:hypothetical protein Tco_0858479 [Tanacetum coccineum]|uniref:Integrase, catalytic region, zinc finger, CCHC-type, peptidase aspartic, catalytic n=1 Tax=Tanacetum coccineum TaxID=301880 RepID=A0ABQ5BC80_9ASTR